jgi:lipoprotein-anchoring transpeptidase ErfK/SrfK
MRFPSPLLMAFLCAAAPASADPLVIPGIGPREASQMRLAPPTPAVPAQPAAYQPAPYRVAERGPLGGGLIEFLVTGREGSAAAPVYAQPQAVVARPQVAAFQSEVEPRAAVDRAYLRQEVDFNGSYAPGTIVVDTPNKFLYLVRPGGRALRYGIGVGRPGFEWAGIKTISRKAEWPGWTPPPEMLLRRPDLPRHMDGGPGNPLGARALYLGSSMYRIHGTNEPETIGRNVSSGCIRMMNEDVTDLYDRVRVGTRVIVL